MLLVSHYPWTEDILASEKMKIARVGDFFLQKLAYMQKLL